MLAQAITNRLEAGHEVQNDAGATELWTQARKILTAYTLSDATLSKETTGSSPATPSDDWSLTDGSPLAQTATATTATDSITGSTATLTGGATWASDDYFNADVTLDGQTGYLTPPPATLPASDATPSISVWFQTTAADGVLVSPQNQALSAGATYSGSYDPVLSSFPVAWARSQAWAASSARYRLTRVAPVYFSPHGMVNDEASRDSSPHACAASSAARRS